MNVSDEILIHQPIVERFKQLSANKRLAHAYLFVGRKKVGKSQTAYEVAKLFSHPIDIHQVHRGDEDSIKIEQIRDLLDKIRLRPFQSEKKVFIIKDVEGLTQEAGNALLKTLEEPSSSSILILTSSSPDKILETIKSRCQTIFFPVISADRLEDYLVTKETLKKDQAHFLSCFSEGALGLVKAYQDKKIFDKKNSWIDEFVFGRDVDAFVKKVTKEKEDANIFLSVLLAWVRDVILVKANIKDERIANIDRLSDLKNFEKKFSFEQLNEVYEEIVKTQKLLAENLNTRVPLLIIKEKLSWVK